MRMREDEVGSFLPSELQDFTDETDQIGPSRAVYPCIAKSLLAKV
jgi:hypothetical protein